MYRSERIIQDGTHWRIDTADHFADVLDHIERTMPIWKNPHSIMDRSGVHFDKSSSKETGITNWAGTDTLPQAIKLGRYGWDQGNKLLSRSLDAANILMKSGRYKSEALDVAGSYPLVPQAVGGDPMCMVTHGLESSKTKPLFRIMVSGSISWNVSVKTIISRGAAILSWVDRLESMGSRCELIYMFTVSGSNPSFYTCTFPIKEAGQVLSVDRAAFMLAHPAMLRRVVFACYERHKDLESSYSFGYGSVVDNIPKKHKTDHSIYFPAMCGDNPDDWGTPARALSAVERHILKALQHDDVAEDLKKLKEG